MLLGIDTGGTFTDFVLFDGLELRIHKVLSTPAAPERAILQGIKDLQIDIDNLAIIHGSTVATNAVLEGKGVNTVFVTNHGLRDLLFIGRQARKQLYNLQPEQPVFPVKREYCLETGGRVGADGQIIEALTEEQIEILVAQINKLAPQSVAINLLFSFLDDATEKKIEQRL
ncbi:MAG: hydantoinase/oxoprolinase family protein, partial [Gammaproteobacteria bacterium]|nr:hydantoinase/oxoprolinase family protein [Gammaproteobacteria bacterium]